MTKGRKTTFEERVEIVQSIVSHMIVIMPKQQNNTRCPINRLVII